MTTLTNGPAGEIITVSIGDKTFRCSRRTAAHLLWTIDALKNTYPGAYLHIMQGSYNTTVAASAGTHDYDACLDVRIVGMDWWVAQKFLRRCGWGAYYRHTGSWAPSSKWHIHMISLPPLTGWVARVGVYVPGQLVDYYAHTFGLANQHNVDADKSWFPGDGDKTAAYNPAAPVGNSASWRKAIDATIFDYDKYMREQPEMNNDDKKWMEDMVDRKLAEAADTIKLTDQNNKPTTLARILKNIQVKVSKA